MNQGLSVLLPAGSIPLNSIVSRHSGTKKYTLKDRLRVFSEGGLAQEIRADQGTVFLVADGDAEAINAEKLVLWLTDRETFRNYLDTEEDK